MKSEKILRLKLRAAYRRARQEFAKEFFAKRPENCSRSEDIELGGVRECKLYNRPTHQKELCWKSKARACQDHADKYSKTDMEEVFVELIQNPDERKSRWPEVHWLMWVLDKEPESLSFWERLKLWVFRILTGDWRWMGSVSNQQSKSQQQCFSQTIVKEGLTDTLGTQSEEEKQIERKKKSEQ